MTLLVLGAGLTMTGALTVVLDRRPTREGVALAVASIGVALAQLALGFPWVALAQALLFTPAVVLPVFAVIHAYSIGMELPRSDYFSISKLMGTVSVTALLVLLGWYARSDLAAVTGVSVFCIGASGGILRRNALTFVMSLALMGNGIGLLVIGHGAVSFAIGLMAATTGLCAAGLVVLVGVHRTRNTVDLDELDVLRDEA